MKNNISVVMVTSRPTRVHWWIQTVAYSCYMSRLHFIVRPHKQAVLCLGILKYVTVQGIQWGITERLLHFRKTKNANCNPFDALYL